jgi:hypothetical protein
MHEFLHFYLFIFLGVYRDETGRSRKRRQRKKKGKGDKEDADTPAKGRIKKETEGCTLGSTGRRKQGRGTVEPLSKPQYP